MLFGTESREALDDLGIGVYFGRCLAADDRIAHTRHGKDIAQHSAIDSLLSSRPWAHTFMPMTPMPCQRAREALRRMNEAK